MNNTEENAVKYTAKQKLRKYIWISMTLIMSLSIVGIMLAFYNQPLTLEDGTPNPSNLWGLETYGAFFTQLYGNTVWLGFGSFALSTVLLMSINEVSATLERKSPSLNKIIAMIMITTFAIFACGTGFILLVGGVALIAQIVVLVLGVLKITYDGEGE